MPFLVAAVVLVGLLCTLDLILSYGVIRRLREHTEVLSGLAAAGGVPHAIGVGEEVGDFSTRSVDGEELNPESLNDDTLVAFFAPNCQPCREKMPKFVKFAQAAPGGRSHFLAVVVGDGEETAAFVGDLSPVARVVVEAQGGPLTSAFEVSAYPTVLTVGANDGGRPTVKANQVDLDSLAVAA